MKSSALALMVGLPAAFAAGWWLHPSAESPAPKARVLPDAASNSRSADSRPGAGPLTNQATTKESNTARTFPQGGARAWLPSLGGLELIQREAGKDALREMLERFTAEEFAELDRAVLEALHDPGLPGEKKKFAVRLLYLAWPEWVRMNPGATLASMTWAGEADRDFLDNDDVQTVFRRYAEQDQEAAIAAITRIPEYRRNDAGHGIMLAAARRDPFAALELIPRLGENASDDPRAIVDAASARDPLRTAALTGPISGDAPQNNTFLRAMEKWCEADPTAAAAWMESYQGPGRVTGLTAVLAAQVRTDLAGVAARMLAIENPGQSPYSPRLAETIARGLSNQSGHLAALEWTAKLPDSLQERAATGAVVQWAEQDASAVSQWTTAQPAGPTRDGAAVALIHSIKNSEPSSAWEWAKSLSGPAERVAALVEVIEAWHQRDAPAAKAAMDSLSPDLRAAMQAPRQPAR